MRTQSIDDMIQAGAAPEEAQAAYDLFKMLCPGLRVKSNGRIDTTGGDKTPLGLYRTIAATMQKKTREE